MILLIILALAVLIYYLYLRPPRYTFNSIIKPIFRDIKNNFDINNLNEIEGHNSTFSFILGYSYKTNKGLVSIHYYNNDQSFIINKDVLYNTIYPKGEGLVKIDRELHSKIFYYLKKKYEHRNDELRKSQSQLQKKLEKQNFVNLKEKYGK
jgi:hypothetical protein